jgi:hypothetical protein
MLDTSIIKDRLKGDRDLLLCGPVSCSKDDIQYRLALLQSCHDREKLLDEIARLTTPREIEKCGSN